MWVQAIEYERTDKGKKMSISESITALVGNEGVRKVLQRFEPLLLAAQEAYLGGSWSKKITIPYGRHSYGPKPIVVGQHSYADRLSAGSSVGNFCSISPGLRFLFLGRHRYDWVSTYPFYELYDRWGVNGQGWKGGILEVESIDPDPIIVKNDVWIAANVTVKQGVTIGDGAVIATESLVTKDVPPYAVVGGNPARILKYRFEPGQIDELLRIAWWEWSDERISKIAPLLISDDIDRFIQVAGEMLE